MAYIGKYDDADDDAKAPDEAGQEYVVKYSDYVNGAISVEFDMRGVRCSVLFTDTDSDADFNAVLDIASMSDLHRRIGMWLHHVTDDSGSYDPHEDGAEHGIFPDEDEVLDPPVFHETEVLAAVLGRLADLEDPAAALRVIHFALSKYNGLYQDHLRREWQQPQQPPAYYQQMISPFQQPGA